MLVKFLTAAGLIGIMLAMGLKVTLAEVLTSIQRPWAVPAGVVANFALVPAATIALLFLFNPDPMVSIGFLVLAVCPGAPVGPAFTAAARGDVSYATGQMVILAGLSTLLSPLLLSLFVAQLLRENPLHIDYLAIVRTLLLSQIVPLAIGLGIHHWAPESTSRIVRPVGVVANILLVGAVVAILASEHESLLAIRGRGWAAMCLLLMSGLSIGWLCGGPRRATRKALAVTTSARNAAVALVIVANNFADTASAPAVVAYALVSVFGTLGCAFLLATVPELSRRDGPEIARVPNGRSATDTDPMTNCLTIACTSHMSENVGCPAPFVHQSMILQLLLAMVLASLTVVIHAIGTMRVVMPLAGDWTRWNGGLASTRTVLMLTRVVGGLLVLHLLEMGIWAAAFRVVGVLPDFESSLYYSLESYTTVGYGDLVPEASWRLVGPIEAAVGILMFGWSTGFIVAALQRIYGRRPGA